MDPFRSVRDLEEALCFYTGAPFCVAVNSCTMALLLAFAWYKREGGVEVTIPRRTYPSVPMSAYHAGLKVKWIAADWEGCYPLRPSPVWDCAKRFTSGMYENGQVQCLSFHARKLLPIGSGGAILHDDAAADVWYRKARFDGRKEGVPTKDDTYDFPGWHCYMLPEQAARGLYLLSYYPRTMPDQAMDDYPDLGGITWLN